jgi:hypothetical protein
MISSKKAPEAGAKAWTAAMRSHGARVLAFGALSCAAACGGGSAPDARYPTRDAGCPVKSLPGEPTVPVDELGVVTVDCTAGGAACSRQLLDAVCAHGGDIAWGLGDNALTSSHVVAHAAHTRRVTQGSRERGCAVQVFTEAPPIRTENIGPVAALCAEDDSKEVCLRELEDQTCLLGGDVVWQVEGPALQGNKQRMQGRAAHTK